MENYLLLKKKLEIFEKDKIGEMPGNEEVCDFVTAVWGYEYDVVVLVRRFIDKKNKKEIKEKLMALPNIMKSMKSRFDKLNFNEKDINEIKGKNRFIKLFELYSVLSEIIDKC